MDFLIWTWLFWYWVETHSVFSSVLPETFNLAVTMYYLVRLLFKLMLTFTIIDELMKKSLWSRVEDVTVQPRGLIVPILCFSVHCTKLIKCWQNSAACVSLWAACLGDRKILDPGMQDVLPLLSMRLTAAHSSLYSLWWRSRWRVFLCTAFRNLCRELHFPYCTWQQNCELREFPVRETFSTGRTAGQWRWGAYWCP